MILTDREILAALDTDQITIRPRPKPLAFSSTSVDLTLAPKIRVWKRHSVEGIEPEVVWPGATGYDYNKVRQKLH